MAEFQAHTLSEQADIIVQYLPNDPLFAAKLIENTNLRKLFYGLSGEFNRVDQIFQSVWEGVDILTTNDLNYIIAWEGAVGIPDAVFLQTATLTINQRRQQILIKLRSLGVLTAQDFIDLAALLGYTITIQQGITYGTFPLTFPFVFFENTKAARFTMIVNLPTSLNPHSFPLTFPFILSDDDGNIIETLFNILKPANTKIIFNYIL